MKSLSQTEIRALYGFAPNQEVYATGRGVKHAMASTRRAQMSADLRTMSQAEWRAKYHDEIMRIKPAPAAQELTSEVVELSF
jgi:hypothetical protein